MDAIYNNEETTLFFVNMIYVIFLCFFDIVLSFIHSLLPPHLRLYLSIKHNHIIF